MYSNVNGQESLNSTLSSAAKNETKMETVKTTNGNQTMWTTYDSSTGKMQDVLSAVSTSNSVETSTSKEGNSGSSLGFSAVIFTLALIMTLLQLGPSK
ncbi:uncharacterized protein LOC143251198 isoform X2 [Tachypleus tridentatus]